MARPKKNAESTSPWVVRDVPEDTRHKVRVYAAEHDMTMAQAVEAIVDSTERRHDRRLLQRLLAMHRLVLKGDLEGAYLEADAVQYMLTSEKEDSTES
jgi:plasmid stability protein